MKKLAIIGSTLIGSAMLCAVPVSVHVSQERVVSVALDTADARVGRPAPRVSRAERRGERYATALPA